MRNYLSVILSGLIVMLLITLVITGVKYQKTLGDLNVKERQNRLLKADNKQLNEDNMSLNDKVWHLNGMLEKENVE